MDNKRIWKIQVIIEEHFLQPKTGYNEDELIIDLAAILETIGMKTIQVKVEKVIE